MKSTRFVLAFVAQAAVATAAVAAGGHGHGHGHSSGHSSGHASGHAQGHTTGNSGAHGVGHAQGSGSAHSGAHTTGTANTSAAAVHTPARVTPAPVEVSRPTNTPRLTQLEVRTTQPKHTPDVINESQVGRLNGFNRREFTEHARLPVDTQRKALALADGKPIPGVRQVESKPFRNDQKALPENRAWTELKPHGLPPEGTARAYVPAAQNAKAPARTQDQKRTPDEIWAARHHGDSIKSLDKSLGNSERAKLPREPVDRLQ